MLEPLQWRVAYLLVQQFGLLAPERMAPVAAISLVEEHQIRLNIDEEEFAEYSVFSEPVELYHLTDESPASLEKHILRHNARVIATDSPIGRAGALRLAPDWTIEQVILRHGHLWGSYTIAIPIAYVASISEFAVMLTLDRHAVEVLAGVSDRK
ncbi:hypothetical protein [Chloroflexus sp.]|uniref:hypothetical protein n=1 Tax=Chloroflexus sp. TaxID=1904827 RepID=UPI00298EEC44|nr:hypothetical protein [Chloroflexus sp.]MDW8402978.1 hypothetical protein [Chloroflexus sp.]